MPNPDGSKTDGELFDEDMKAIGGFLEDQYHQTADAVSNIVENPSIVLENGARIANDAVDYGRDQLQQTGQAIQNIIEDPTLPGRNIERLQNELSAKLSADGQKLGQALSGEMSPYTAAKQIGALGLEYGGYAATVTGIGGVVKNVGGKVIGGVLKKIPKKKPKFKKGKSKSKKGKKGAVVTQASKSGLAKSTIDDVVNSSARGKNSQITEGARAIAKKIGHAQKEGYTSAFNGIAPTQANAESLIKNIMSNPTHTFQGNKVIDVYNSAGQGVRFETGTSRFMGFLEASRATQ